MGQTNEFAASLLIVRQAASLVDAALVSKHDANDLLVGLSHPFTAESANVVDRVLNPF